MANPIENIASKAMGTAKKGKAMLEGLTGVFRHLAEEHGEVTALMLRVRSSHDIAVRARLYPEIRAELLSHEMGERKTVFPALHRIAQEQNVEALQDIVKEHEEEAGEAEDTISMLDGLGFEDPSWGSTFEELLKLVTEHATQEENDWFGTAEAALGKEYSERLLPMFEAAKKEAKAQL